MKMKICAALALALFLGAPALGAQAQRPRGLGEAEWQELFTSGSLEAVRQALRTEGADAALPDGNRPVHVAAEYASDPGVINLLVAEGASLSAPGLEGLTPLMLAAAYNPNPAVTEALIRAGASVDVAGEDGRTPLHLAAAMNESPQVAAALLRHGASANRRDAKGRTPLWLAAARAAPQAVELFLDAGASVDEPNGEELTPLQAACVSLPLERRRRAETVHVLVEAGADVNRRDAQRCTPLMRAITTGADRELLEVLAAGRADLLAQDDQNRSALFIAASNPAVSTDVLEPLLRAEGTPDPRESGLLTPLMEACRADNLPAVRFLLSQGANPGLRDKHEWTPLDFAASANASEGVLRLLAEAGTPLNEAGQNGLTPLMAAVTTGAGPRTLKTLVSLGADPNLATWDGLTPLMLAARRGGRDTLRALAEAGAQVDQRSRQGTTALMVAAVSGAEEAVEELLALSADVSLGDREGMTALAHALQAPEDNSAVLGRLLKAGAAPDSTTVKGMTPLMDAALRGETWGVRALLEAGADARAQDFIRWTPLHFAARGKTGTECLPLLLEAGAELDAPDAGGTTPLMVAAACDNAPMVKALLEAGANPGRTDRTGRDSLGYARLRNAKDCLPLLSN